MKNYLSLIWVLALAVAEDCNKSGAEKDSCLIPTPFRIKRQVNTNFTYSCSDVFTDFTCTEEGRFPDLDDATCTWYFECVKVSSGKFLHKYVQCPEHKFSPALQECSSTYNCPCDKTTLQPRMPLAPDWWCRDATLPQFVCERAGRFPDLGDNTCRQYILCSKFHNATWLKTSYACSGSSFDPVSQKCNANYKCPCEISTTLLPTTISATTTPDYLCNPSFTTYVAEFNCRKIGRYPDLGDTLCEKYFLCSKLRNDTWIKTRYSCSGSTFDPSLNKCSIHYPCPCQQTTTTTQMIVTTEEITTLEDCSYSTVPFECPDKGRYPNLSDTKCKSYFLCSSLQNGTLLKTNYTCSGSAVFDPVAKKCSSQYVCPCGTGLTTEHEMKPTTTATSPHRCSPNATDVQCTSVGRFADLDDLECQSYFLCSQFKNGTWAKKSYKCSQSVFDPVLKKCSIAYACPCKLQPTPTSPRTTLSTQIPTTQATCAPPSQPLPKFDCTNVGRFPDLSDENCTKYYLCSRLNNGSWIKTRYSCKDSTFSPEIEKCHIAYPCPCLKYYTTPLYIDY